ncbi:hypothetical protein QCA50_016940 [Cerrena zonata]|uniref:Uncharacterized protein n=1 Tax=Cerrena zonata TaxID=2478898 RepID=A0AAW0FKA8_9APHY
MALPTNLEIHPNLIIVLPGVLLVLQGAVPSLVYLIVTLTLHLILTSLIILWLWKWKIGLRSALGYYYGKHYTLISIMFAKSTIMNVACSILLLTSLLAPNPWFSNPLNFASTFKIWIGITPAVQVSKSTLSLLLAKTI